MFEIDDSQCTGCKHKQDTQVFQLCKHEKSHYSIAGSSEFHTRTHMIKIQGGKCEHREV